MVGLADPCDLSRLEAACSRTILAAGTDRDVPAAAVAGDGDAGAFLHGPASFANVVAMPGTITSDALDLPAASAGTGHDQARS